MERKLPISYLQQIGKITILQTRVCDINNSLTELKEKCSRLFKGQYFKQASKKRKQKQNKRKAKKAWATRMEANCKRVVETIAPPQESHDVREPIGPLSLHYEGISGLLKNKGRIFNMPLKRDCSPKNHRTLSSNIYAST